jgi:hypothetical protein
MNNVEQVKKLMNVRFEKGILEIIEVKIEKETEKQFKLLNTSRRILNKSEMGIYIDYYGIYCYEDELKELTKLYIEKEFNRLQKLISRETEKLNNYKLSLEVLNK